MQIRERTVSPFLGGRGVGFFWGLFVFHFFGFCFFVFWGLHPKHRRRDRNTGTKRLNAGHWEIFRRAAKGHSNAVMLRNVPLLSPSANPAVHPSRFLQKGMGFKASIRATWHCCSLMFAFHWFNHLKWFLSGYFRKSFWKKGAIAPRNRIPVLLLV